MTRDEFVVAQHDGMRDALSNLIDQCSRRFLKAAHLVNLRGPIIEGIDKAKYGGNIDLTPLLPAWEVICERYRQERLEFQGQLFQDHASYVLERWSQFLYWELLPALLEDDEFVRNVLRVSMLLPCHSTEGAAAAICHQLSELHLPYGTPAWDSPEKEG